MQKIVGGISIVVPVYNSEQSLSLLAAELHKVLPALNSAYELILVNDASPDKSWQVIQQITGQYSWLTAIDMMRNYGQHSALLCGFRAAQYPIITTMDDDLQHPPAEISKPLDKLHEGYDVVYGTPQHEQHGLLRNAASQLTKPAFQSASGVETARNVSAFRAELRGAFADYRSPYVNIDVLLTWDSTGFSSVAVQHDARRYGQSNYGFRKLVTHTFNMMTGFSVRPLQVASALGFTFTLFGVLVFMYVVGRYIIQGGSVPGVPFLASIVAIFSGVQLFFLGVIGEYLARMHFRLMDRPTYLVRHHEPVREDVLGERS